MNQRQEEVPSSRLNSKMVEYLICGNVRDHQYQDPNQDMHSQFERDCFHLAYQITEIELEDYM